MRFGDSLTARSVAQWRSYNVDYASVKQLIKENTTPGKGKAVSIPGQGDTVGREFGQLLFSVLRHECDRVDMFVKSKCYEVNSRMSGIERKLAQLPDGKNMDDPRRGTLHTRRKLSRIETDILAVGEEIENLSRFITVNRLAVRKLLKKFRKWTGQTALGERVENQIINQPGSFARVDLKPALDHYSTYLDIVRNLVEVRKDYSVLGIDTMVSKSPDAMSPTVSNERANSPLEFDVELASAQAEWRGTDAAYWIHTDNVVQLRILLLQYMRYAKFEGDLDSSRRGSAIHREERMGVLLWDDPDRLRTRVFKMSSEDRVKMDTLKKATVTARWIGDEDAEIAISADEIRRESLQATVKQDHLASFLNGASKPSIAQKTSDDNMNEKQKAVRTWFSQHTNSQPLTCYWQQRSRFVGLDNSATFTQGLWATLDEDIRMAATSSDKLQSRDFIDEDAYRNVAPFPHAVLVVKFNGDDKGLLRVLDHSHLTERVPGFSVEAHALSTCCPSLGLLSPSWYQTLQKDIRHIPSPSTTPGASRRNSCRNLSTTSHTPRRTSQSATSRTLTAPTSPQDTAAPPNLDLVDAKVSKSKRVTVAEEAWRLKKQRKMREEQQQQQQQQYWNEYDNGSEFGDDQGFIIYVDPDAPVFPTLTRWTNTIKSFFSFEKPTPTTGKDKDPLTEADLERQPLNPSANLSSDALALTLTTDSSGDEDTDGPSKPRGSFLGFAAKPKNKNCSYGGTTTATRTRATTSSTNAAAGAPQATSVSTICLAASLALLAIVTMLALTGRHKLRHEIDVAILVGVVAAVGFAVGGVVGLVRMVGRGIGSGSGRGQRVVSRWWRAGVGIVFAGVCVWAGGLVAWVLV